MTRATYNFLRGMGSVMDLMPARRSPPVSRRFDVNRSDSDMLRGDWRRVAGDFRRAFDATVEDAETHVESKQSE